VLIETVHAVLVDSNPFENAISIQETMIEYGNFSIRLIHKLTVEIYLHRAT